jgi:hypothetical protein
VETRLSSIGISPNKCLKMLLMQLEHSLKGKRYDRARFAS